MRRRLRFRFRRRRFRFRRRRRRGRDKKKKPNLFFSASAARFANPSREKRDFDRFQVPSVRFRGMERSWKREHEREDAISQMLVRDRCSFFLLLLLFLLLLAAERKSALSRLEQAVRKRTRTWSARHRCEGDEKKARRGRKGASNKKKSERV